MLPQLKHRLGHYFDLPPRWCWVAWGGLALGALGTFLTLGAQARWPGWGEWVPLVALLTMGAWLYWFDCRLFEATHPRPEDLTAPVVKPPKESA